ncbi:hypothetical protein EYZ11_008315 [Aspergillus tanneri]|uniref:Pentacotripeptide-repeat region of PRORP domain-containing protein n=1 Tax=Aspergillus tanneri TaxID=1220188 RepID=A0A4S3JB40_9EURO|nr:hypothetical protein EYZ11_008315 [Aspergillus tanneri]
MTSSFITGKLNRDGKCDILPHLDLRDDDLDLLEKISTDCQGSFREAWEELGKIEKADHWKRLSLWLLHNSPELAWEFLLVTCQSAHKPVFLMVANSVIFLDAFYSDKLKRREIPGHTYRSVIETCLDPTLWPVVFLPQKGVRLYIQRADRHKVYQAYNIVHERGSDIKAETWLCFMHRFTELGDVDKALEALAQVQQLKRRDFTLDSVAVMRHCCKLLLLDSVRDDSKGRNFRILPKLLEMGVRPDRDMMNIVLANAFKTGDPQLGYDMLTYMKNQGIEPDSYTYLTLLNDAVVRGDRERVDLLTQEIRPVEEFQKNPWIASKLLHAHFTFTAKHIDADVDPNTIFYSMLDMYNQLYDLTPLKELTIIPPQYAPLIRGDNSPPSVVALYIIIATYLRCQNNVSNAQRVYTKFKSLVAQGHKTIAPLQVTDHVYNEFLVAFRDDPRGLRPAVRLVEDMLQASNDLLDSGRDSLVIVPAKPTVRTWTLLLATFIYSRQPLAAEKVKDMMAKHQVEYNVITWNVIISGYANAQNIPEVAKTIKAMEKQGFAIDEWTMKSLRYLRDPERLWVALEELDKGPEPRIDLPEPETASPLVLDENEAMENERQLDQGLQRLSRRT